jgi:cardiolipin-specific phospholipase
MQFVAGGTQAKSRAPLAKSVSLGDCPSIVQRPRPPSTPSTEPITATSSRVYLRNPSHYLNMLSITPTEPSPSTPSAPSPPPAVLLHGYGAGLGFFFHNFPTLGSWAAKRHTPVYALDWLGMGRSHRPPFTIKAKKDDIKGRVEQAESFFIDSLEEWRETMGLGKMTLIGHSLGAYFSVAYALKYPDRVNKLILLSPAGFPRGPNWTDPSREIVDEGTPNLASRAPSNKQQKIKSTGSKRSRRRKNNR